MGSNATDSKHFPPPKKSHVIPLPSITERMFGQNEALEPFFQHVRIYLRGGDIGVAKHLLHCPEVSTMRQKVRRERMPQLVGANA